MRWKLRIGMRLQNDGARNRLATECAAYLRRAFAEGEAVSEIRERGEVSDAENRAVVRVGPGRS